MPLPISDTLPADTLYADSLVQDSLAADSLADAHYGLLISRGESPRMSSAQREDNTMVSSWVFVGLALLFCLICIKFRKNAKFFHVLFQEATANHERENMLDGTVRERTFMFLLGLLGIVEEGILLWRSVSSFGGGATVSRDLELCGYCAALAGGYTLIVWLSNYIAGYLFMDQNGWKALMRSVRSCVALMSVGLFLPVVLLLYSNPGAGWLIWCGLGMFTVVKIVFILRIARIFMHQNVPWLIFLCYLCSVEITPVLIIYGLAREICLAG